MADAGDNRVFERLYRSLTRKPTPSPEDMPPKPTSAECLQAIHESVVAEAEAESPARSRFAEELWRSQ